VTRASARVHLVVASVLAILLVAAAASPVAAAPHRVQRAERLAYRLVDCLRTGGKVTLEGRCRGYAGGRYSRERRPLARSDKISNQVSWPWARELASSNSCTHELGRSSVDWRFRSAGFMNAVNGENVACHSGKSARAMVIYWVRYWYRERKWGGPHWRQIKDPDFRSAGFGVARTRGGRTRLVINFYGRVVG
jgi:hypothetical protein